MYKKQKPEIISGIIEVLQKGEVKKGEYLGNSDYSVISIKLKDNEKIYEYNLSVKEDFDIKVGDNVFFRSNSFNGKNRIIHKSLGKKINLESENKLEISNDLLEKLNQQKNKIKP